MKHKMTKNIFISILFISNILFSQNPKIDRLIRSKQSTANLKNATWSLYAAYVDNGQHIIDYQSQFTLTPASGLKLVTTAAALEILGEEYQCITRLYYDGSLSSDGILKGNIYIRGGGDPTLGSDRITGSLPLDSLMITWVNTIKKTGIKNIEGSIFADALLFDYKRTPDYWSWIDIGNYYGAGPCALSINDNLYYLLFEPGKYAGQPAKVLATKPEIPGLTFINHMQTGPRFSGDNGYIYAAPGQFEALLDGTVPAGRMVFKIKGAIPDPALYTAQRLYQELINKGIIITDYPAKIKNPHDYNSSKLIHTTVSPSLKDIVFIINKKSFNLYAEQLVKLIALSQNQTGSLENGLKIIENFLKDNSISTDGLALYDGSGLSRSNLITTKTMVELLKFMTKQSSFESYYNSLSVAGDEDDEGNFNSFGNGTVIEDNARIKSGFISNIRSHSGYVRDRSGRLIAFSFICNNYHGSTGTINKIHKNLMIKLAEQ
ncbi:MAG: D-alanyl-D-alanine carboxypeptidase/D-alanyl-D-alanine-endopeptidase [Calditrichaceae bacterium]